MKITLYTKDEACTTLVEVQASHITMFNGYDVTIHFTIIEEQLELTKTLIKHYVHFTTEGLQLTITTSKYPKVRFRFDNK